MCSIPPLTTNYLLRVSERPLRSDFSHFKQNYVCVKRKRRAAGSLLYLASPNFKNNFFFPRKFRSWFASKSLSNSYEIKFFDKLSSPKIFITNFKQISCNLVQIKPALSHSRALLSNFSKSKKKKRVAVSTLSNFIITVACMPLL